MSARDTMMAMLEGFLSFGKVTATKQATATKQVLVSVRGNSDGTNHEERPYQALWGNAAILFRPAVDTEVIFTRLGDEMIPIASRETRWAIEIAEGEVVLRNLVSDTASQAYIHIKANGEVIINSPKVYIGDGSATEKLALGTAIKGHFDAIKTYLTALSTHATTHTHGETGATTNATLMPIAGTNPSVPDVESRHLVEN